MGQLLKTEIVLCNPPCELLDTVERGRLHLRLLGLEQVLTHIDRDFALQHCTVDVPEALLGWEVCNLGQNAGINFLAVLCDRGAMAKPKPESLGYRTKTNVATAVRLEETK